MADATPAKRKIMGLVGASGSGKTTLASRLVEDHGFLRFHIGDPLKDMLRALGLSDEDVAGTQVQRIRPQPLLGGKSARYALSTLGTEWGRNMITPDLWANSLRLRVERHLSATTGPEPVVIDDLRFPSDWAVVLQLGGIIVTVRRPTVEQTRTAFDRAYYRFGINRFMKGRAFLGPRPIHESEFHWPDAPSIGEIWNTGTVDDLVNAALAYWNQIGIGPAP